MRRQHRLTFTAVLWILIAAPIAGLAAADVENSAPQANTDTAASAAEEAYLARLRALKWVHGPTTVEVIGDSKLVVPEG